MIVRDTIEKSVKYALDLIKNIHRRQNIGTSKLNLYEIVSAPASYPVAKSSTKKIRVIFTPATQNNKYAELGIAISFSSFYPADREVYLDPAYLNSGSIVWIVALTNTSDYDVTAGASFSVIAPAPGTLTQVEL